MRPTEFGARCVVVVGVAHDPDSEGESCSGAVVGDGVPGLTGENDALMRCAFYEGGPVI